MLSNKKEIKKSYVKMWIENGIFHSSYPPELIVTLEIAEKIVADRIEYIDGVEYPSLVDIRNIKNVEYKAMKYWASKKSYSGLSKIAIFSDKKVSMIIFNFWLHVDKPYKPTKYFTNIGSAYLYLKTINQN